MSYQPSKDDMQRILDTAMGWGRMQERQDVKKAAKLTGAQKWHWFLAGGVSWTGFLLLLLHLTGRLAG